MRLFWWVKGPFHPSGGNVPKIERSVSTIKFVRWQCEALL
jgi:hypothetical protein